MFSFKRIVVASIIAVLGMSFVPYQPVEAYSATKVPVYRFYHYKTSSHFYTTSHTEKERVITKMKGTYRYEGEKFSGWKNSDGDYRVPVSRFYRLSSSTHFYTISPSETARLKKDKGFRYEGISYYGQKTVSSDAPNDYEFYGQCPLWRFYNFTNKTHFYTASLYEAADVATNMSNKYRDEGVAFYVWKNNCLYDYLE